MLSVTPKPKHYLIRTGWVEVDVTEPGETETRVIIRPAIKEKYGNDIKRCQDQDFSIPITPGVTETVCMISCTDAVMTTIATDHDFTVLPSTRIVRARMESPLVNVGTVDEKPKIEDDVTVYKSKIIIPGNPATMDVDMEESELATVKLSPEYNVISEESVGVKDRRY